MSRKTPHVLIVEDAPDCVLIVKSVLSDLEVTTAATLQEAQTIITDRAFDLYILDLSLPDGDTLSLCQNLRKDSRSKDKPILFLSARGGEIDKLTAFARGADDYVTKPFSPLELKARVQAKLRAMQDAEQTVIEHGPIRVDIERRQAVLQSESGPKELTLTALEFGLLVALAQRPEVVKSRQSLLDEVWGSTVSVTDRTVDVHIYNLRKKLGEHANLIQAHHGAGYVFKVPQGAKLAG